jgi:hypothetical protein
MCFIIWIALDTTTLLQTLSTVPQNNAVTASTMQQSDAMTTTTTQTTTTAHVTLTETSPPPQCNILMLFICTSEHLQ